MNTIGNTSSERYIRKIDYREPTADYKIASQVEDNSRVLEIGTSSGYMSEFLTVEKNCKVIGVEYNKELFERARKFFEKGFNKDLNDIASWHNEIENNSFDYVICQDVLEHLLNPFEVLEFLKLKLKKGGKILVSIPNVSHNAILMEILKDDFSYEQSGSLDYTHFKFYTAKSFKDAANKIGLKVFAHDITYLVPEDSSLNNSYMDYSIKEREVLFDHYNGHVFQNIFTLVKEEDFEKTKEKLMQFKLPNYDEVSIKYNDNNKKYYYHEGEVLEIEIAENTNKLVILPSIRLKKYNLDLKLNGENLDLNTYKFPSGVTKEHTPRYISTGTEYITLDNKFSKGDKITLRIYNCESIFDEVINGKSYYESEIVKLKSIISEYKVVSFASLDTLFLRNYLNEKDLEFICKKFNFKLEDAIFKFIILNPFIKEIIEYAKLKNIKTYVVTSKFLNESVLKKLIKKYNIEEVNIISKENIHTLAEENILHIGNDIENDILNFKRFNIDTYLYKEPKKRIKNKNMLKVSNISESILRAIQINNIYCGLPFKYFEKFGMEEISSIYFYFTNWLYNNTKKTDNLFFLSRDGYIPHIVYNKILKKNKEKKNVKYIYASRKAYQIPGLVTENIEKCVKTFTEFNLQLNEEITLRDSLTSATLIPNEVNEEILKKFGFKNLDQKITYRNINNAKNLLKHYQDKIKSNLELKLDLAKKYLIQEGLGTNDIINVVDIGWRGSVQNYIQSILNKDVRGYYVGTMPTEYKKIRNKMYGCYANKYLPLSRAEFMVDNIMMMEIVFTAPAPQLIEFSLEKGKVIPVFSKVNNTIANESIKTFQNSALNIIDQYISYIEYLQDVTPDFSLSLYKDFIENKNYEDVLEFKRLETNIGYGEKQRKYVETVSIEELVSDQIKVYKKANYAFWKGAIYIKDVDSVRDYKELIKKYNFNMKIGKIRSSRYYRSVELLFDKNKKNQS